MEEEGKWPAPQWKLLGCPFSKEEKDDIESIERQILELKLTHKHRWSKVTSQDGFSTSNFDSRNRKKPYWHDFQASLFDVNPAHQTPDWVLAISDAVTKDDSSIYSFDEVSNNTETELETPPISQRGSAEKLPTVTEASSNTLTSDSRWVKPQQAAKKHFKEERRRSFDPISKRLAEESTSSQSFERDPLVQSFEVPRLGSIFARDRFIADSQSGSDHRPSLLTGTKASPSKVTPKRVPSHSGIQPGTSLQGRGRQPSQTASILLTTDSGTVLLHTAEKLAPTTSGASDQNKVAIAPLRKTRHTVAIPVPTASASASASDISVTSGQTTKSTSEKEIQDLTTKSFGLTVDSSEGEFSEREETDDLIPLWKKIPWIPLTGQFKTNASFVESRGTEVGRGANDSVKTTSLIEVTFSTGTISGSSYSSSSLDSSYASLPGDRDWKPIRHLPTGVPSFNTLLPKRPSIWVNRPKLKRVEQNAVPSTSAGVSNFQAYSLNYSSNSIIMSSTEHIPGAGPGKRDKEQEKREKEREKKEKEKEKREKKEKEKKEKEEHERREKEKKEKEKEKREKDKKEREEREKKEREEKERERREREQRRRAQTVVTQTPEAVPTDEDSDFTSHSSFFWRLFHTLVQLLFICLLLLTIGSLGLGVGSLFAKSAMEVAQHFQKGLCQSSYVELSLALIGFLFFLLILSLTILSAVMLIPALWVSLIEIIICPWSIISDYFLP